MRKILDLTGQRFGRLTAHWPAGRYIWLCACECGKLAIVHMSNLRAGRQVSCGCFKRERTIAVKTKHGHNRIGKATPEYRCWQNMLTRCRNPKYSLYDRYGGRGIRVCKRWLDFRNFLADMGMRPSPELTIERINNDGNYEPGNCCWATKSQQALNRIPKRY